MASSPVCYCLVWCASGMLLPSARRDDYCQSCVGKILCVHVGHARVLLVPARVLWMPIYSPQTYSRTQIWVPPKYLIFSTPLSWSTLGLSAPLNFAQTRSQSDLPPFFPVQVATLELLIQNLVHLKICSVLSIIFVDFFQTLVLAHTLSFCRCGSLLLLAQTLAPSIPGTLQEVSSQMLVFEFMACLWGRDSLEVVVSISCPKFCLTQIVMGTLSLAWVLKVHSILILQLHFVWPLPCIYHILRRKLALWASFCTSRHF